MQSARLSKAFQAHQVQRSYLAVVYGSLRPGFEGEVMARLRVDEDRVRLAEEEDYDGLDARTKWKCLDASPTHSLLELSPSTGRKHQLRIHCAEVLKGEHDWSRSRALVAGGRPFLERVLTHYIVEQHPSSAASSTQMTER